MSEPVGNSPRNIPGNSHKERETRPIEEEPVEQKEKVEKIIEGKVVKRRQSWWKRAARSVIADDAQNIGDYLLSDVILPATRNFLMDLLTKGGSQVLYGSAHARSRGRESRISTRYDRMSEEPRRVLGRDSRARHDFDEVILDSRAEAVAVIDELILMVQRYGSASVSDLYDLVGVTGSYADQRWGWTDLGIADVRQTRGGFLLDLPRPELIR